LTVYNYIRKRFFKIVFTFTILISLAFAMAVGSILYAGTGKLPQIEQFLKSSGDSTVFDANGRLLAKIHAEQSRSIIPLSDISDYLANAAVAVEDERFYDHSGVDIEGIFRALRRNVLKQKVVEGGSTISQQLVKNLFMEKQKTATRKIKEALMAMQMEQNWGKDKILENYLNIVYFGKDCYGVGAAAEKFFGKKPSELDLSQSALLAGVIRSPIKYSPYDNPLVAKNRRDFVLSKMLQLEVIDENQFREASKEEIKLRPWKPDVSAAPYFVEYLKQTLVGKYGSNLTLKGNLKIYSTLEPGLQSTAESAIKRVLNKKGDPSSAVVSIEPSTGYIKALVGGTDYLSQQFNLATQGKRQPGSAFKPFVLIAALAKGISPDKIYESTPVEIPIPEKKEIWKVANYEGTGGKPMTLRDATIYSINAVYARLITEVGPEKAIDIAHKMGIESEINPDPAIALGGLSKGVSPLEMASAYATLANNGQYVSPIGYTKIVDQKGNVIEENKAATRQAIAPSLAYLVSGILKDVINKGTGRSASIARPAAGKTGTTQNYRDAWFIGYTPQLSTAVWVGYPQAQIEMTNVHGIKVAGGTLPASIWSNFMFYALKDKPVIDFTAPNVINKSQEGYSKVLIDPITWKRATTGCPNPIEVELENRLIPPYCTLHKAPESVKVPDVTDMSSKEAKTLIEKQGLKMQVILRPNKAGTASGKIFDQSPKAEVEIPPGSNVKVFISR
jgi:penicillin-binding protein 1A